MTVGRRARTVRYGTADPERMLTWGQLRRVRLFIGTPVYQSAVALDYAVSMLELTRYLDELGVFWRWHAPNGEMVARARNRLIADFLETDCTHMVQIDSDMGFPPHLITDMLRVNVHVIGALYPLKELKWSRVARVARSDAEGSPEQLRLAAASFCYNPMPGTVRLRDGRARVTLRHGALEVSVIGTGLFMVSRGAIETMIRAYPETAYVDDTATTRGRTTWALFDYGVERNRYLSEDYRFCVRWRAIGGRVWAWPWAELRHTGAYVYRGAYARQLTPLEASRNGATPGHSTNSSNHKEVIPCH